MVDSCSFAAAEIWRVEIVNCTPARCSRLRISSIDRAIWFMASPTCDISSSRSTGIRVLKCPLASSSAAITNLRIGVNIERKSRMAKEKAANERSETVVAVSRRWWVYARSLSCKSVWSCSVATWGNWKLSFKVRVTSTTKALASLLIVSALRRFFFIKVNILVTEADKPAKGCSKAAFRPTSSYCNFRAWAALNRLSVSCAMVSSINPVRINSESFCSSVISLAAITLSVSEAALTIFCWRLGFRMNTQTPR